jgi:hypothetical protein
MSTVEVKLSRADRIFRPGEVLEGVITVRTPHPVFAHLGIWVKAEGNANLQVMAHNKTISLYPGGLVQIYKRHHSVERCLSSTIFRWNNVFHNADALWMLMQTNEIPQHLTQAVSMSIETYILF